MRRHMLHITQTLKRNEYSKITLLRPHKNKTTPLIRQAFASPKLGFLFLSPSDPVYILPLQTA